MIDCGVEQDSEDTTVKALILCSENADNRDKDFDDFVTSGWDEVSCGWRNTKPNAHYVLSSERRKRSKEKLHISPEPDSQLAKVKKLAGMIANSNLHRDGNSSTKLKSARISNLTKYKNCGVLSYDVPCWRFIVDPKKYHYVERLSFLELRCITDNRTNTHTILLENGGMITCQEIDGRMALFDPALSFDRHLIDTYADREEFKLRSCRRPGNCSFDFTSNFYQTRTENRKIHVVETLSVKPTLEPCSSVCEMCRHRTQELEKTDSKCSISELKPLLKVTPTQRRVAEDSRLAGKILVHHGKTKDLSLKALKVSKKSKNSLQSRPGGMRLDWLPITRSTIAYPYDETMTGNERVSNDKFPDRALQGTAKTFALPRGMHAPKARKLTLSEAANLVPKASKLGHAIDKLTKELENNQKPLSLSEPILPSVSGTKLGHEVSLSSCLSGS